ncbi:MAG TPA: trypsin-like peptidase domain-containing protein [Candidatus Saccharimonadia bacterium]
MANSSPDPDYNSDSEDRNLPYGVLRRLITLTLAISVVSGIIGAFVIVNYFPGSIPVTKRAVILQENSATIEVAKKVSPSVVSITSESIGFSFFGGAQTQKGAGTGFLVSEDGLIVTNNHVIEGATTVTVFDSTGKQYKNAEVVATDPQNDIAFIRIKATGLKPLTLGDSGRVQVGSRVVAIGNALGQFQNTVTEGIISGLGRPVVAGDELGNNLEQLQNLFQTDAAINPGNSGGPLVDLSGNVIGINTAVAGGAQNIGFAIPINEIKKALATVKSRGSIIKPFLGIRYIPVTPAFAAQNNLPVNAGVYVAGDEQNPAVVPNSPAAKAGLKDGDIITKIGNQAIDEKHSLSSLIAEHAPGEKVPVTFLRDGKTQTAEVTLEEAPKQ